MATGFSVDPTAEHGKHVVLGCSHIYSGKGEGLQYRLTKIENPIMRRGNPFMSRDDARRTGETIRQLFSMRASSSPKGSCCISARPLRATSARASPKAYQDQALPWLHVGNDVGTRPDRRLECRIVEVLDIRAMLRQHGHHGERQRHFAVEPAKIEANRHKIERFRPFDPAEGITLLRPTLLLEEIEGEQHVGCAHRYAVRKPRPRVEAEDDVGTGIVGLDRLGAAAERSPRWS